MRINGFNYLNAIYPKFYPQLTASAGRKEISLRFDVVRKLECYEGNLEIEHVLQALVQPY